MYLLKKIAWPSSLLLNPIYLSSSATENLGLILHFANLTIFIVTRADTFVRPRL